MWPFKKESLTECPPAEPVVEVDRWAGSFAPLLTESTEYISLLHLGPDSKKAFSLVAKCCSASSDPYSDLGRLLRQVDWRSHLVAAAAIAILPYNPEVIGELWNAIDAGSWVTPQLAAVAALYDPAFAQNAEERLRSRCVIKNSKSIGMSAPERDSLTSPAGSMQRSAKTAASLIRLQELSRAPESVSAVLSADVSALASKDVDFSGDIAERWLLALRDHAANLGIVRLAPSI